MPQYFSPGVYVEEVDSGPRPIQGVSTSVTGAVGVTQRGPTTGKPELVTNFADFRRKFGGFLPEPDPALKVEWEDKTLQRGVWWRFADSVRGFFENGGQQLYVKRVAGAATPSTATLKQNTASAEERLAIEASSPGTWGNDVRVRVREVSEILALLPSDTVDPNSATTRLRADAAAPASGDIWALQVTSSGGFENGEKVQINGGKYSVTTVVADTPEVQTVTITPSGAATVTGTFALTFEGQTALDIPASINDGDLQGRLEGLSTIGPGGVTCSGGDLPGAPIDITFTGTLAGGPVSPITSDDTNLVDGTMAVAQTSAFAPGTINVTRPADVDEAWPAGTAVRKLRQANDPGSSEDLFVIGAGRLYGQAMVELNNGSEKEFHWLTADPVEDQIKLDSATAHQYVEGDSIRLIEAEVTVQYAPGGDVVEDELFTNLKLAATDPKDPLLITNRVSSRSNLVDIKPGADGLSNQSLDVFPSDDFKQLAGGKDNYDDLNVNHFVGVDGGSGQRTGIKAMEDIEDISIVMAPGMWARSIVGELLRHSRAMRYRVAVLDAPLDSTISEVQAFRAQFDSKYAALYYPWVKVRQPGLEDDIVIPPSGHVAGIYADVDRRRGVHKAPANEILQSITEINQDITRREQDLINPRGINALRFFPGRGNRVWGARTISSDANFRYVNVRRTFNFIERSIDVGTDFVVFEPNTPQTWSRVRQTINNFLNTQWREGKLDGRTAEEAYFVACDLGVTMTQDDVEQGKLICEIGIAPVFPAEFVIFRIQKFTAESRLA